MSSTASTAYCDDGHAKSAGDDVHGSSNDHHFTCCSNVSIPWDRLCLSWRIWWHSLWRGSFTLHWRIWFNWSRIWFNWNNRFTPALITQKGGHMISKTTLVEKADAVSPFCSLCSKILGKQITKFCRRPASFVLN